MEDFAIEAAQDEKEDGLVVELSQNESDHYSEEEDNLAFNNRINGVEIPRSKKKIGSEKLI